MNKLVSSISLRYVSTVLKCKGKIKEIIFCDKKCKIHLPVHNSATHSDSTVFVEILVAHSPLRYIYHLLSHRTPCFYNGYTFLYNYYHTFLAHNLQE